MPHADKGRTIRKVMGGGPFSFAVLFIIFLNNPLLEFFFSSAGGGGGGEKCFP